MPSVTVHLQLAARVLDYWTARPRQSPFPASDPVAANAFRQGAIGPDLGYMPGATRILSDLAHSFRSGDLARTLIHTARTPIERAFAWGWVTHVMADALIHPVVGCAVGELVSGSPAYFIDGDSDPLNHVRVEVGLDALYAERHPGLRRTRIHHVFDSGSVGFIVGAYRETYGVAPLAGSVLKSHRLTAKRVMQGLGLENLNLDTGRPDLTELQYSGLHRSLEFIERRGGAVPALPPFCPLSPVAGAA